MIVFVDLEHEQLATANPDLWWMTRAWLVQTKYRLEGLSGKPCLIVRYDRVCLQLLSEVNTHAVVVNACFSDYDHYSNESLAGLHEVYQNSTRPLLGLCAGFQLLAQSYGAVIGPMGALPAGMPDPFEGSVGHVPSALQERGFLPVRVDATHDLFAGLGKAPRFFQAHYWEVKGLPAGFDSLASSELCPIQAIAHHERPLYGVQFHADAYDDEHPDGRQVLINFLRLAGVIDR
jgi:GMP synthase-like glutamine amidotransferase